MTTPKSDPLHVPQETLPAENTAISSPLSTEQAPNSEAEKRRRFEDLPPAAQRALKEAEARRAVIDGVQKGMAREIDGRGGLEPTRYNDWEIKGLTSDF